MYRNVPVFIAFLVAANWAVGWSGDVIFFDGFESGNICAWSNADPADCLGCVAGEFSCYGNSIMACDVGPPAQWVPTGTVCSPYVPNQCDAVTGTCVALEVTGTATATGNYYEYAKFTTLNSTFLGGYDVGSFADLIYVNRNGTNLDVYQLQLVDSDGDSIMEPNQHPDNPDDTGPIEQRVLNWVTSYVIPELGTASQSELYPLADRVYFVGGGGSHYNIYEYIFSTDVTAIYAVGSPLIDQSFLGFGEVDGMFFSGREEGRLVYSLDPSIGDWVAEFRFPSLVGTHFDGLEVVVDPSTGTQYVYVSDDSSDYLGQYRRDPVLGWVKENVFQSFSAGDLVEGMGFGALNHFWFTRGDALYEMGGGDLTPFLE